MIKKFKYSILFIVAIGIILVIANAAQHSANHWCNITNCENARMGNHLKINCPIHRGECTQEDYEFWCLSHSH